MKNTTLVFLLMTLLSCNSNEDGRISDIAEEKAYAESNGGEVEENIGPNDGYIDWLLRLVNNIECDLDNPTKTIGKETWTYCRIDLETETAFVEFQLDNMIYKRQFVLYNNELIFASEEETTVAEKYDVESWSCEYFIKGDTVLDILSFNTFEQDKTESEDWNKDLIFEKWKTHQANFYTIKASRGFDGITDVAALEIHEAYYTHNDPYIRSYFDPGTPLKIVISRNTTPGGRKDEILICVTEEEKIQFFMDDDGKESRGRSMLQSTFGNKAVFKRDLSDTGYYIKELIFSGDNLILQEIRIVYGD
jgi:hypothetical protein